VSGACSTSRVREAKPQKVRLCCANDERAKKGLQALPAITPHSLRRTWATFAAIAGRHPKWIAAQIGHTNPALTFQVYEQVATRRYLDEKAVWNVMRFADEPEERTPSRQLTRTANGPREWADGRKPAAGRLLPTDLRRLNHTAN
jgi:hypothetical protein